MRFSVIDFFNECEQMRRNLRICSHLLKKSLVDCAVSIDLYNPRDEMNTPWKHKRLFLLCLSGRLVPVDPQPRIKLTRHSNGVLDVASRSYGLPM